MNVAQIITIAIPALAAVGATWAFVTKVLPLLKKVVHFLDDWFGEEPRAGLPKGRPGIPARIYKIEHELYPNSGASIRDAIDRLEVDVASLKEKK